MLPGTTPVILLTLWWPLPWTQVPWLSFQGHCQILSLICFKGATFLFGTEAELSIIMCDLLARLWSTAQNIKLILKVKGGKYSWEILWRLETSPHNYSVVQFFVCILSIFCSFLLISELDKLMVLLCHAHPPPCLFPHVYNAERNGVVTVSASLESLFLLSQAFSWLFCLSPELTDRMDLETGSFLPSGTFQRALITLGV